MRDIGDDARRQYIDARSAYTAWEDAVRAVVGRTDARFTERKNDAEARERMLATELKRHQRMNHALYVGRAPRLLIRILEVLQRAALCEHFRVIGTHALYAYEAAAGVRIGSSGPSTVENHDLFCNARTHVRFLTQLKLQRSSMIGLLRKVDPTFEIRDDQRCTAVNAKGFKVDIIRREAIDDDPHPLRLTDDEDDFWAVQARRAGSLSSAPPFSAIVVSSSGHMARMHTISPIAFSEFKRWMANQKDRDAKKRDRDGLQADIVDALVEEYLPQLQSARRIES